MRFLFLLLLLLGIIAKVNAQDMMLNGSFEDYDGNPDGDGDPSTISYAAYWRNLIGTCDLVHPDMLVDMSGTPCFGGGCGRFGVPPGTGSPEYFYGKTLPLTAGQIYEVSFWFRKDNMTDVNKSIGMVMSETVPTSSIASATPLILVTPESTQCVKVKACFTAQHSVTHYLTFGPYNGFGSGESMVYIIDSVSVQTISPTTALADANLSVSQPVYCMGDQVFLDGSASSNETSYEWKIFYEQTQIYSSGVLPGTAGVLNPLLAFMVPGSCYHAELTVYGVCKDVSTVDFCFADPNIDFIFDGNPVCENFPVDLQVTGDNGWTYTWSDANDTLSSGVGLKTLTVTPTIGNATYTVTVTTLEGCTHIETLTLNVNTPDNIAPWMDGINGTGEYTYYVSQGDAVFFNSLLSNDHPNELMFLDYYSTVPSGYAAVQPSSWGNVLSFSWVTSLATPVGEYHYFLTVSDQNACSSDTSIFDFRIIVVCDQCPVCLSYEDRTPVGTPLPPETKAGKCIEAGLSQTVSTGDANVLFQAGVYITEGPYFEAGPGYEGIIDPTTCLTDCEDCCVDWDGFHFDNAYYTYINLWDGDPTNDHFELTDFDHPFCSYGSKRFDLYLDDADDGSNYAHFSGGGDQCCMLQTRTPENPIPHSSIFWDGYLGGEKAQKQYYRAHVYLYDCNDEQHDFLFSVNVTALSGMTQNNSDSVGQMVNNLSLNSISETSNPSSDSTVVINEDLGIYPNPATNMLYISGSRTETTTIQLYDEKGRVLTKREKVPLNQGYNLEAFSSGKYYCRIYKDDGTYVLKQFVKL